MVGRALLFHWGGGLSVGLAAASGGLLAATSPAHAEEISTNAFVSAQFGLDLVEHNEADPRMWYYRFATDQIAWNPGVNVLVPEGYRDDGRTYPVLYLLHGGGPGQDFISWDRSGVRELPGQADHPRDARRRALRVVQQPGHLQRRPP